MCMRVCGGVCVVVCVCVCVCVVYGMCDVCARVVCVYVVCVWGVCMTVALIFLHTLPIYSPFHWV